MPARKSGLESTKSSRNSAVSSGTIGSQENDDEPTFADIVKAAVQKTKDETSHPRSVT